MVGWHHRLDAHESEQTPGVGDREAVLSFPLGPERLRARGEGATEDEMVGWHH